MYDWEGKEDICYRMYVVERKHLDEVVEYFQKSEGFKASKRAFQVQFKRWDFPSKQNPAHKNQPLIDRVKDLWEKNVGQKDMLDILEKEGFRINDRELMRLRIRFRWLLRKSTGAGEPKEGNRKTKKKRNKPDGKRRGRKGDLISQLGNAILDGESATSEESESESEPEEDVQPDMGAEDPEEDTPDQTNPRKRRRVNANVSIEPHEPTPDPDPGFLRQQEMRKAQMQAESDELWAKRKRRRRTRGYAGMPADPKQPPRFPSETTLDESKAFLNLDNDQYRQVRDQFQALCQQHGVIKKTTCGPEKWVEIKDLLIRGNEHINYVFQSDPEARLENGQLSSRSSHKALCLDVICLDVTKRMRTMETRMSLQDAKNILAVNPEESRIVRDAFYDKLKSHHFTNKLEMGVDVWNNLKDSWIAESDVLQRIFAAGPADPQHDLKKKAAEFLCRDVMKRYRSDQTKKDPSKKQQVAHGPGPGPAPPSTNPEAISRDYRPRMNITRQDSGGATRPDSQQHSQLPAARINGAPTQQAVPINNTSDLQIDPSLLLAASHTSILQEQASQYPFAEPMFTDNHANANSPLPVYFRLHPDSTIPNPSAMTKNLWLSVLQTCTVAEIRELVMREHPGTLVLKIEGVVKQKVMGQPDREMVFVIDDEEELQGYLGHVAGGKATFLVLLGLAQGGGGYV